MKQTIFQLIFRVSGLQKRKEGVHARVRLFHLPLPVLILPVAPQPQAPFLIHDLFLYNYCYTAPNTQSSNTQMRSGDDER